MSSSNVARSHAISSSQLMVDGGLEASVCGNVVGNLQPGDGLGETAFLFQQPRTLDVYAVDSGTRILSLSERVLSGVVKDEPAIATKSLVSISKTLCRRAAP